MTPISDIEKLERLLAEAVIGPWRWYIEDHSMATLSGPDELRNHVMSVSPCKNCMVEGESPIGKCTMPNQNTCDLIALLRNFAPSLIADWKAMRGEKEKRDQFNYAERLRLEQANLPSEVSEEDKRVSYEIYAPEFGAIHSDVVVSKADTLEEAEKKFKTACEKWLYVRLVEVTKRTIKREYPNKR